MKNIILSILTIILFSVKFVSGAEGCLISSLNIIYTGIPTGTTYDKVYPMTPTISAVYNCSPSNNSYATNIVETRLPVLIGTSPIYCDIDNRLLKRGTVHTFTPIQCPLDSFSLLLVVLSGGLGLIFIKKYKFCMMM